jgi:hypothetical protein
MLTDSRAIAGGRPQSLNLQPIQQMLDLTAANTSHSRSPHKRKEQISTSSPISFPVLSPYIDLEAHIHSIIFALCNSVHLIYIFADMVWNVNVPSMRTNERDKKSGVQYFGKLPGAENNGK